MVKYLNSNHSFVIGIAGGSGSGKTYLARALRTKLVPIRSEIISQDYYYKDQSDISLEHRPNCNYDEPASIDFNLMVNQLSELKCQHAIDHPLYDFTIHNRKTETRHLNAVPVLIVEGILIFTNASLLELFDLKIYVDTPPDVRLARRLERDIQERGRDMKSVLAQYHNTVSPMHKLYVEPVKSVADVIIQGQGNMEIFAEMIACWINT